MSVKDSKAVFTPDPNDPAMFAAFKAMAGSEYSPSYHSSFPGD